jgi:hypothetical protein
MAGRPPIYENVEDMQRDIDSYFKQCDSTGRPYTVAGLALALDMTTESLMNYQKTDLFFGTVKKAKQKCETQMIERGLNGDQNATMTIFLAKCNYGYVDQPKTETQEHRVIIEIDDSDDDE